VETRDQVDQLADRAEAAGGSLHAMMLDMKRTFDEIVEAHAEPSRAAQILANPFYQSLSSGFSGTQEYMAMEKLGQLRRARDVRPEHGHAAQAVPQRGQHPARRGLAGERRDQDGVGQPGQAVDEFRGVGGPAAHHG
jgi:hypothetical protein